jgi:hypothetical protein
VFLCRVTLWSTFRRRRKIFSHFFLMWRKYSNRTALERTQLTDIISVVLRRKVLSEKFRILFEHSSEQKNIFKVLQVWIFRFHNVCYFLIFATFMFLMYIYFFIFFSFILFYFTLFYYFRIVSVLIEKIISRSGY